MAGYQIKMCNGSVFLKIQKLISYDISGKLHHRAAVLCSPVPYWLGGVDQCIFVTGKPRHEWHWCMGAWRGEGGLALGVLFYYFGVPV